MLEGLNEPFVEAKHGNTPEIKRGYECLLDYMKSSTMKMPFYLRNFLAVSKQIFNALTYFEENKFVHRDIKRSNILMEKFAHCPCEHPILCCCKSEGTILCKIADFDLMDKAIATDSKFKTLNPSPGGSKGMIAPEVFFKDKEGKKIFSPKSDVWSTCITLMHVLVGKYRNNDTLTQLITFFNKVNIELPEIINKCATSIEQMKKIQSNPSLECALQIDCEQIIKTFDELKTSLENMKKFQMQNDTNVKQNIHGRKQGDAIYCPIAEILASVYGVQILPYVCQEELSGHFNAGSCFNTILKELCRIIQMGIRFQSDQRLKASDIMQKLQDLEVNVDIGNELMRREE
ncbi:calcium-dependent protein kinase 4-like [Dysidea avara]|uniref:calcium-dependent protein kinase 4-like n=1 Tax=Dysidea avara TaxID=196820 RepID=UPI0033265150